jgi:hypothetical protein
VSWSLGHGPADRRNVTPAPEHSGFSYRLYFTVYGANGPSLTRLQRVQGGGQGEGTRSPWPRRGKWENFGYIALSSSSNYTIRNSPTLDIQTRL